MKGDFKDYSNFFEDILESLKMVSSCPICNTRYNSAKIKVLEERSNAHLIYIKCCRCQGSVLALVLANQAGVSSIGIVTDLSSEDVVKFKEQEVVSVNDVIDIHQFLKKRKVFDLRLLKNSPSLISNPVNRRDGGSHK